MIEISLITQESGNPLLTYTCEEAADSEIYIALGLLDRVKTWLLKMIEDGDSE